MLTGQITITCPHCEETSVVKVHGEEKPIRPRDRELRVKKQRYPIINFDDQEPDHPSLPVRISTPHAGFWITVEAGIHTTTTDIRCDRNSVMLCPTSLLYVYKLALRHLLLSEGLITPRDIDPQNLVPHIVARKNKIDPKSNYEYLKTAVFTINEDSISIKRDFMIIELDRERDIHMTLIYSKNIKNRVNLLSVFKFVLRTLNAHPELISQYRALDNFGIREIEFWYMSGNFPSQIKAPEDFAPITESKTEPTANLSAAGSILGE